MSEKPPKLPKVIKEPVKEPAKEPTQKEPEKKSGTNAEKLDEQLQKSRQALIDSEFALKEFKKKGQAGGSVLEANFNDAEKSYKKSRFDFTRSMKEKGVSHETIFEDVILREQDVLAKARFQNLVPTKKTWFRSLMGGYIKMPMWKRVATTTAMVTGTIATGGLIGGFLGLSMGFATGAAALGYGTQRFVRGMIGGATGGFVAGWVKKYFGKKIEKDRAKEIMVLRDNFGLKIDGVNSEQEFHDLITESNNGYEQIVKEANKKYGRSNIWAMGAAAVAGLGTLSGVASASLDGPMSDYLNTKLGFTHSPEYSKINDIDLRRGSVFVKESTGNIITGEEVPVRAQEGSALKVEEKAGEIIEGEEVPTHAKEGMAEKIEETNIVGGEPVEEQPIRAKEGSAFIVGEEVAEAAKSIIDNPNAIVRT